MLVLTPSAWANHAGTWDSLHTLLPVIAALQQLIPGPTYCFTAGSPVDVASGNYFLEARDIYIPAQGPDFALVRTYNSLDQRNGLFGNGWSFSYDQRLIITTDEVQIYAICRQGTGRRERFTRNPDGTYLTPKNLNSQLADMPGGGFALTEPNGAQRQFDPDGRLLTMLDPNGNAMTLTYDATGFLTTLTDANGRTLTFTKGSNGRVDSVTDFTGRSFRYGYDANGNLTTVTDFGGAITTYRYDAKNRLTAVVDASGNLIHQATYDEAGRVATYREGEASWTITYLPEQKKTTERGFIGTWTYIYNDDGNIVQTTDPIGNVINTNFDARAALTGVSVAQASSALQYDSLGRVTGMSDGAGGTVLFSYDAGTFRPASIKDPNGGVTQFGYDGTGRIANTTLADGSTYQYAYDERGNPVQITDATGNSLSFTYDPAGRLTSYTDAAGNVLTYGFDDLGHLISITDSDGRQIQCKYDANDRLTQVIDAAGGVTRFTYNANNQLTGIVDPKGNPTQFEYDTFSRLSRWTNPRAEVATYRYDQMNKPVSINRLAGLSGRVVRDQLGRVTRDNDSQFTYDSAGNLVAASNSSSSLTFRYDKANRPIEARTNATSFQQASVLMYAYDATGRITSMLDILGGTTQYTYDAMGRPVSLTNPGGEKTTFTYDALGRRTSTTFANGVTQRSSYDSQGRLARRAAAGAGGTFFQADYTYLPGGARSASTDSTGQHSYKYDALGRLVQAAHPSAATENYQYDGAGNRVSSHLSSTYVYDAANRLMRDDQFTYFYDGGNLRTKQAGNRSIGYSYESRGFLSNVDGRPAFSATYVYDALGRRMAKTVNSQTTRYIYDRERLLYELDSANNVIARYTWGPYGDDLISQQRGGASYFYQTDPLGSVVALTDATGAVAQTYEYDSYGQITKSTGNVANPFRFTGRVYDEETGLYYFRTRMYDPSTARFTQEDKAGIGAGDLNLFRYVHDEPLDWVDPWGLCRVYLAFNYWDYGVYHSYIVTQEDDPNAVGGSVFRGGPSKSPSIDLGIALPVIGQGIGAVKGQGPYGLIQTNRFPFSADPNQNIDYNPNATYNLLPNTPGPCQCYNDRFAYILSRIESAKTPYNPWYANSNSVTYNLLLISGMFPGVTLPKGINVPGWGRLLPWGPAP